MKSKFFRLLGIFIGMGINTLFAWIFWPSIVVVVPAFLLVVCLLALGQELLTKQPRPLNKDIDRIQR
jgi:hypothetical protein